MAGGEVGMLKRYRHIWKRNEKLHNANKGITLIELIVVIALIVIFAGAVIGGLNFYNAGNSRKAVKKIYLDLSLLRSNTLSVSGIWETKIYKKDNQYIMETIHTVMREGTMQSEVVSTTEMGSRIELSCNDQPVDEEGITISFTSGSGTVKSAISSLGPVRISDEAYLEFGVRAKGSTNVTTLKLYYSTGKVVM